MELVVDFDFGELREAKKEMIDGARKALYFSMLKMMSIAKEKSPSNTAQLRSRINLKPEFMGSDEYVLSDGTEYGSHVEYGTKPHWAPIQPLKDWSRLKLGNEGAAYAVQKKIAKYGTPAQPFFRPAILEVKYVWLPYYLDRFVR